MSRLMTKLTKWHVRRAKTQISLGGSVFAVHMMKAWVLSYPLNAQRRLIWLGGCPVWSESSLGARAIHDAAHINVIVLSLQQTKDNRLSATLTIWAATWQNQQSECAPSEDSDQPGHPPSLIRVFAMRSMGSWRLQLSSCGQRRLWSDWADLSLRWAHTHFVGFVMSRLISSS